MYDPMPQCTTPHSPFLFPFVFLLFPPIWQGMYSAALDWAEPIWLTERMHNTPHRTVNPEEADFFYIPLFIR